MISRFRSAPLRSVLLVCGLMAAFVTGASSRDGSLGNEVDKEPLEYTTVAGFIDGLPKRKDVEATTGLPLEPGMRVYQTRKSALKEPAYEARTWMIFVAPHPMAPSVARLRTYVPPGELWKRRQAWASRCESTPAGCLLLDAYLKKALKSAGQ